MRRFIRVVLWSSPFWLALWLVWTVQMPHTPHGTTVLAMLATFILLMMFADLLEADTDSRESNDEQDAAS